MFQILFAIGIGQVHKQMQMETNALQNDSHVKDPCTDGRTHFCCESLPEDLNAIQIMAKKMPQYLAASSAQKDALQILGTRGWRRREENRDEWRQL
jgi:hypothetical protein